MKDKKRSKANTTPHKKDLSHSASNRNEESPDVLAVPISDEKEVAADTETLILASGESDATAGTPVGNAAGAGLANEQNAVADTDGNGRDKNVDTPYIVGIGASAGGLEALEMFFRAMPTDSGIIFIVVTHLKPDQVSMLPEIISQHTMMPVQHIQDGQLVQPNNVYIIPPAVNAGILNRTLQLFARESDRPTQPINFMLRSLAQDHQERSIAIILSGTGSDGTEGIRAIKSELGMVIAQEPETAKFTGMPQAAIDTGVVDYVLPPDEMPSRLVQYVHARERAPRHFTLDAKTRDSLQKVIFHLRRATGHDFSEYKKTTILRRIDRRMRVHNLETIHLYAAYLQRNNKEVIALFRELLIGVTDFFRDQEAFQILKSKVLPMLLDGLPESGPFRVWVPGVATGEEAYSNAIMIMEYMEEHSKHIHVQIFATDINEDAIEVARRGVFPVSIEQHVSQERLAHFFKRHESGYRIKREIREMIIFSTQNLIKDAPFTKLDLVCCRNLLIYLDSEVQRRIIPLFHYSLKPEGILFLGSSESIGEYTDLYSVIDAKWKIFKRKSSAAPQRVAMDFAPPTRHEAVPREAVISERNAAKIVERQLLALYAPTSIVVNRRGDILYIHGRTGRYLEPAQGQPKLNAFEMAREGLAGQLQALVLKASTDKGPIRVGGVHVGANGDSTTVNLTVQQLPGHPLLDGAFLIGFEEEADAPPPPKIIRKVKSGYVGELERELETTRDNLQATIEVLQTSNEELRSMNEEYQSTNEELQSANEELETSREEMQSLNEELSSLNAELQEKIDGLKIVHLSLDSIAIPSIFLNSRLEVLHFTSQAQKVINLLEHDIGRPLDHISNKLRSIDILEWARRALHSKHLLEREVQSVDGDWYLMRLVPYPTDGTKLDGLVITFVDIHSLKAQRSALESARTAEDYAQSVMETVFDMLLIVDEEMRVISANDGFLTRFGLNLHAIIGKDLAEITDHQWDGSAIATLLRTAIANRTSLDRVSVALTSEHSKLLVRSRFLVASEDLSKRHVLLVMHEV